MIVAENLTKYYGLKPAVQNVSFRIEKGEIVGLLGPNGAGKTTLLRILTGFFQPTSGKILVDGLDGRNHSLELRKKIGFLPETVPLYDELSVKQFLSFSGTIKGLKGNGLSAEIDRVTSACGLIEHSQRRIRHLSKGLKQRVGLAQALLNDPPMVVLDEPTTGLDPTQIVEVRRLIKDLAGQRTVLLSTHILPEVSQVCERVIIVNQGRVVAEDTPANLTGRLQKGLRTVLQVDGPGDEVRNKLASLPGVTRILPSQRTGEFLVESAPDESLRPLIAKTIVESGWGLREMRTSELSLEDVFVQLVTEEGKD
ncbi:MAG: ABC transporter ATP-binding protein [Deltaproteobacteria bacterium]